MLFPGTAYLILCLNIQQQAAAANAAAVVSLATAVQNSQQMNPAVAAVAAAIGPGLAGRPNGQNPNAAPSMSLNNSNSNNNIHGMIDQQNERYLVAAYRVGMLALDNLGRKINEDRPQVCCVLTLIPLSLIIVEI